jgi:serine/threonine-protein kinase
MLFTAPDDAELVAMLATGSVFQVALVRDHGELAVCKRLLPRVRAEPAARAAMVREAMVLTRARHAALPALRRVGSDTHGPFVIEARVEGTSVRALVEGWRARGGPVPPRLVAHLAHAAAAALAEVHALGVSHGDLGPAHVVLGLLGDARFLDFGAARFTGMEASLETADRGTLPFVAPEVARGETAPGQGADVYALAATLLFLATGGPMCAARDDAAMLLEIGERGIDPELCARAQGLSAGGQEALRRALALSPTERLGSAEALAEALT